MSVSGTNLEGVVDAKIITLEEELTGRAVEEFKGQVASIAPRAKNVAGIVTYEVRLDVEWSSAAGATQLPILTGMTADADLVTSRRTDVLLVPNRAITADRDAGTYHVYRVDGDAVEKVQVAIGLRDKNYTEITSGVQEGDELVIGYVEAGDLRSRMEDMRPH